MEGGMFGGETTAPSGGMLPKPIKHDNPRQAIKRALEEGPHLHGALMWMAQLIDELVDRVEALEKGNANP